MTGIQLSNLGDGLIQMQFDLPGKSANVFTDELLTELATVVTQLEQSPPTSGLIATSAKPGIFIAGADLAAINSTLDWDASQIEAFCRRGQRLFDRLGQLPCPVIAAIGGVCVGGGLEFALACDYRIATDERKTLLGLPEVKLGLIPGWGGTVRLPRMIGLAAAAELTCSGELVSARRAKELGFVDEVVSPTDLLTAARRQLHASQNDFKSRRRSLSGPVSVQPDDVEKFKRESLEAIRHAKLHPHAPETALDQIIASRNNSLFEALDKEATAMTRVYGSDSNAGLLNAFFLGELAKKLVRAVTGGPCAVSSVGIAGIGLMGGEIAQFCSSKTQLRVFDVNLHRAQSVAEQLYTRRDTQPVIVVESAAELADCDLIIEAITESAPAKQDLLKELDAIAPPTSLIATNTSVISIDDLAKPLSRPDRFCGIHFCYPVAHRSLVEVVRGEGTSPATIDLVSSWLVAHKKTPLVVDDHPGFVVNRVLCPMLNEANHLLCSGNSVEVVDRAMRTARFEFGPLEFMDWIGLDISYAAGLWLFPRLSTPIEPSLLMHAIRRAGYLGRKTGAGYYTYNSSGQKVGPNSQLLRLAEQYTNHTERLSADAIFRRLMLVMVNQAADVLYQRTVDSADQVDLAMIAGAGLPDHFGGVLFWANRQGVDQIVGEINSLNDRKELHGRFRPTAGLLAWSARKLTRLFVIVVCSPYLVHILHLLLRASEPL